jgi:hypothetical protein
MENRDEHGRLKKGHPGLKKKGDTHKATRELKEIIDKFVTDKWLEIEKEWQQLEPKDKTTLLERLTQYRVPKKTNVSIQDEYKELEKILHRTPEEFIEKISEKIIELNNRSCNNENE